MDLVLVWRLQSFQSRALLKLKLDPKQLNRAPPPTPHHHQPPGSPPLAAAASGSAFCMVLLLLVRLHVAALLLSQLPSAAWGRPLSDRSIHGPRFIQSTIKLHQLLARTTHETNRNKIEPRLRFFFLLSPPSTCTTARPIDTGVLGFVATTMTTGNDDIMIIIKPLVV